MSRSRLDMPELPVLALVLLRWEEDGRVERAERLGERERDGDRDLEGSAACAFV
jgi:hypothetical protein